MKHFVITIILCTFAIVFAKAQSADQNYIVTRKMINNGGASISTVQYFDGLGYPTVAVSTTGENGSTAYTLTTYDGKRREERQYLPTVIGSSLNYVSPEDIMNASSAFHGDGTAYTQNHYDALDRVTSTDLPGQEWRTAGRTNGTEYSANTDADKVKHYEAPIGVNSLTRAEDTDYTYYPAGTLRKEITHDADGKTVTTFTNLFGEKILERTAAGNTYYVYNDLGQLRYVLTPKYQSDSNKGRCAYEYRYDSRGRVVKKILPGCEYIQYWYDKADRLLYMQDATLREKGKYRFMLYDALGRLCVQGLCSDCKRSSKDGLIPKVKYDPNKQGICNTGYVLPAEYEGTLLTEPVLEIANYYDNYDFGVASGARYFYGVYPDLSCTSREYMMGYQTGSVVATSDGNYIATVQWNDIRGNVLGTSTRRPDGKIETELMDYSFTNNVANYERYIDGLYGETVTLVETNTYSDVTDRLTGTEITLDHGSGEYVKAVTYGYDDLGRLASTSRLLSDDAGNHTVNYTYDMRGWTREINSSNGFMEKLWYQDGATPCYNGNISSMTWRNSNVKEWIPSLDYIKGDVNGDGSISMSDANMVISYYLAVDKPSDFNFAAADVNGDGYISMSDASQISNMYFGGGSIEEYKVYTDKLSIKENQYLQRRYDYSYDGANRMTSANYAEERTDGTTAAVIQNYNEWMEYDQNGNITKFYRNGKMQNGNYGYVDKLTTINYSGNQMTGAKDTSNPVTAEGSTDFKGPKDVYMRCSYNGVGSLVRDDSRGIALIEYDDMNNPKRIQFTNGNVTKYVYSATGEKLRTIYQTAVPNITVAVGTAHELTASELLYADSTDYYHGGKLTVKNGRLDKYYFDGGYAQATMDEATQADDFAFFYYTADHLGNVREVIDEKGDVVQITNYYPFGTPYSAEDCATHNPDQQNHKYNGKEFDTTHGLNTYDYGARQYNSLVGRWDRIDPLCEKYYSVSPYAYCANNPVLLIDPNGEEVINGIGTTSDEHITDPKEIERLLELIRELRKNDGKNSIMIVAHGHTDDRGQCTYVNIRSYNPETKKWQNNEISNGKQLDDFLSKHSKVWQSVKNGRTKKEDVHIVFYACKSAGIMDKISGEKVFEDVTFIAPNKNVQYNRFKDGWETSVENTKWIKNENGNYVRGNFKGFGEWMTYRNGRRPWVNGTYPGGKNLKPGTAGFKYNFDLF